MDFFAGTSAQPRDYQSRICEKAIQMFDGHWQNRAGETPPSAKSVLIDAPTGSGKTVVGLAIAQYGHLLGKRIGWVAMRRNLLVQAAHMRDKFGFDVPDMKFISMFDKNPPTDIDWLLIDECLPYDMMVDVLVDGIPNKVMIGDLVTKNIGTHVLSYSHEDKSTTYQPITTRMCMGVKSILEFTIKTDNGTKYIQMTDNGRIWTQDGYKGADNVNIGDKVLHIESCCATFLSHETRTNSKIRTKKIRSRPKSPRTHGTTLQMWMQTKSSLVFIYPQIQNISIQSPSKKCSFDSFNQKTRTNNSRNSTGGWFYFNQQKSNYENPYRGSQIKNTALHKKTVGLRELVKKRIKFHLSFETQNCEELRFWKRSGCVLDIITPKNLQNLDTFIHTKKDHHRRLFEETNNTWASCLVDGRRFNYINGNSLLFYQRTENHIKMVEGSVQNNWLHRQRQESRSILHKISTAECLQNAKASIPICNSVDVLQNGSILTDIIKQGEITDIRRIESKETFDIGVANNHNFFANTVLVHNCSHDATNSMAHIHATVKPERVIGLSATPYRSDHARLSFERVIKDIGIHELIDQGWLSPYSHFTIPSYNPESVTNLYGDNPGKWGKSIMFFLTMAECEATKALLEQKGIVSEIVWGGSDRFDQLQRFQDGKIHVLISMSILTEGFDSEDLQTVFVRPSSKGPTIQMAGRVLRKCDGIETKNIIQCQDTRCPFTKIARPARSYLLVQDEFRSLALNVNIERISNQMIHQLVASSPKLPIFIQKAKSKLRRSRRSGVL